MEVNDEQQCQIAKWLRKGSTERSKINGSLCIPKVQKKKKEKRKKTNNIWHWLEQPTPIIDPFCSLRLSHF